MPIAPEAAKPAAPDAPSPPVAPAAMSAPPHVESVPSPAPVRVPPVVPAAVRVAPAEPLAKTMRSLDEVRADLARLRESAKQRHARVPVPVRRDISFEPTDFMDFAKPEPERAADESFEQTAFLDFTTLKPPADR